MRKIFFIIAVFVLVSSTFSGIVQAQDEGMSSSDMASPIDPRYSYKPRFVGAVVGFGPSNQSGSFLTDKCDCPEFTDGTGINVIVGGFFEQLVSKNLTLGASVLYNYRSLTAEYTEREYITYQEEGSSDVSKIALPFLNTTKSSFTYITVQPYIKYYLIKNFFARVSPALSFNVGSSLIHEKELLQTTAVLPNGERVAISLNKNKDPNLVDSRIVSDTKAIIQDTQFPKMTSFVLSADMALGVEIKAGKKMSIAPVLQYSLPFMDVSSSGTAFRLPSFLFCIEVKYNLD